jgi:HNH endonuclease
MRTHDTPVFAAHFWRRVAIGAAPVCWDFKGFRDKNGYGYFSGSGRTGRAHRLAWELVYGPIPSGMLVCHACDNPTCCNPGHLWLGTQQDNARDRERKGRGGARKVDPRTRLRGEAHGRSRLTDIEVVELRRLHRLGVGPKELARRFAMPLRRVTHVIYYDEWKHVPDSDEPPTVRSVYLALLKHVRHSQGP